MNKQYFFCALLFYFTIIIHSKAQSLYTTGARALSLSNAVITQSDVFATQNNVSGIAPLKTITAGLYYENRFILKELASYGFAAVIPMKLGNLGVLFQNEQSNGYNTLRLGGAFAKQFGKFFNVGMGFNYVSTSFADAYYGKASKFTANIGMQATILDNVQVGVHIYNPTQSLWKKSTVVNEYIPTVFSLGIKYTFSKVLSFATQFDRNSLSNPNLNVGIEYLINKVLYLRGGISTGALRSSFGFGYVYNSFLFIDVASAYHINLGFVPQVSVAFKLKEKSVKPKSN